MSARTLQLRRPRDFAMGPGHAALAPAGGPVPGAPHGGASAPSATADPALRLQVSALQALCRQVFGFRLAMIALAAPAALLRAAPGAPVKLVGAAVVLTFMGNYVLFRDWERCGPLLLRHPSLLAADTLFASLLLFAAGPDSTLAYVTVCTPLLAGLVYGWRGSAFFVCFQSLILVVAHSALAGPDTPFDSVFLMPGLCVVTGALGVTLRNLMLRFGAASQALTETRSRLAVAEAVGGERARLAREMHDSVAKTLHGLALAADGLAASADTAHPGTVRQQAELVGRSARRAAAESRELLSDLRRQGDLDTTGVTVADELAARTADFARRTGIDADFRTVGSAPVPQVPHAVARHLLTVASEALENAHRHAHATRVCVETGVVDGSLRISVQDDGRGLPEATSLDELRRSGHFGLVGMVERAVGVGARIRIGKGRAIGTEVRVDLPVAALPAMPPPVLPPTARTDA